jgi:hypothetical protein
MHVSLSREATNTNYIIFGLTRSGFEPTIYRTLGKHANHYTTDVLDMYLLYCRKSYSKRIFCMLLD